MNLQVKSLLLPLLTALLGLTTHAAAAQPQAVPWRDLPDATDCSQAPVGVAEPCGTVRIVAVGGSITFASSAAYTVSGSTGDFYITPPSSNACVPGQTLTVGSYCLVGFVTFQPTSLGPKTYNLVSKTVPTSAQTGMIFGSAGYNYAWQPGGWSACSGGTGTWSYSGWSPTSGCGNVTQNQSASCVADALSSTQSRSVTCLRSDGTTAANTYCAGAPPATMQSCTPTTGFSCGVEGATSQSVFLTNACTYSWVTGTWSTSSNTCSAGAIQTRTVTCVRSDGTAVADASCTATKPAVSQTVNDFSGCTYGWQTGSWAACSAGSGTWSYAAWSPASGCGVVTQTRSASCGADAGSGTQARTVTCMRSDGTAVADGQCASARPATSESCTPTSGFSCGTESATSQSVLLTDACTYSWFTAAWSASSNNCSASATQTRTVTCVRSDGTTVGDATCTATKPAISQTVSDFSGCTYGWQTGSWAACSSGSGTWTYSAWSPISGCGVMTQTRSASCGADAGSGTQARTATCMRSDGTAVVDSQCTGTKPATSASCTPTSGFSCGTQGAISQSALLTDACTYSWLATGFGTCSGGNAHWVLGEWTPPNGCGPTLQSRSLTCTVDANSGSQTQSVSCIRSDGSTVVDANCPALTRPVSSESCTPSTVDCGAAPVTTQSVVLTSACPSANSNNYQGCIPDPANGKYCVFEPL